MFHSPDIVSPRPILTLHAAEGPDLVEAGEANDPTRPEIARRLAHTPSLLPLVERLAVAAEHDLTILLTGETGSGKTSLARLIHDCSPRRSEPFLAVACGAIAPPLFASEFFGHVRGAFTGACRSRAGKFAAAGRGTLLLDEIDVLTPEQQASLLGVLETGQYEPVGSDQTQQSACRILVASNADLEERVEQGQFRRDLYYRLNVLSFHLPPLRERVQDIAPLARALVGRLAASYRKELSALSPEALAALEAHPWSGNIRELENALQQAVLVSRGPVLRLEHLPESVQEYAFAAPRTALETLQHNREVVERRVIRRALVGNGYCRVRAARQLGISRITLYKKLKKYGSELLEG